MISTIFATRTFVPSILIFHIVNAFDTHKTPFRNIKSGGHHIIDEPESKSIKYPTKSPSRVIFHPPNHQDESSKPWLPPALKPEVLEFKNNVLKALLKSPKIREVWHKKIDSDTTRVLFFKLGSFFLKKYGHQAPEAFANIVSKCASLFDKLTQKVYFEAVAISLAEFLISEKFELDKHLAQRYAQCVAKEMENANLSDTESYLQAYLDGYTYYLLSFGYKIDLIIDKTFELFGSRLIAMNDSIKS